MKGVYAPDLVDPDLDETGKLWVMAVREQNDGREGSLLLDSGSDVQFIRASVETGTVLKPINKSVSDGQGRGIGIDGTRDAFLTLGEHDSVAAMSTFISS